jgi:hypothetical protein
MSSDAYDRWFGRIVRLISLTLGSGGFAFEVISPNRTLWVGLLSVGLIAGNVAGLAEALLTRGVSIRVGRDKNDELE